MIKNGKMMRIEFSGHSHYGDICETSNSCGNCDGALCQECKDIYIVEEIEGLGHVLYAGYSKQEALDILNE